MARFSNSDDGYGFIASFCERCIHWTDHEEDPDAGFGCPVMDAHLLSGNDPAEQGLLDMLITQPEDGDRECKLYRPVSDRLDAERHGQNRLFHCPKDCQCRKEDSTDDLL